MLSCETTCVSGIADSGSRSRTQLEGRDPAREIRELVNRCGGGGVAKREPEPPAGETAATRSPTPQALEENPLLRRLKELESLEGSGKSPHRLQPGTGTGFEALRTRFRLSLGECGRKAPTAALHFLFATSCGNATLIMSTPIFSRPWSPQHRQSGTFRTLDRHVCGRLDRKSGSESRPRSPYQAGFGILRWALDSGGVGVRRPGDWTIIGSKRYYGYEPELARSKSAGPSWPPATGAAAPIAGQAVDARHAFTFVDTVISGSR